YADDDQQAEYEACEQGLARLAERTITIIDPACSHLFLSLSAELYDGALPCDCDPLGSVPGSTCNPIGGSCSCKPGVFGQQCDRCEPGYFNMTARGCSPCSCIDLGAQSLVCDYVTGQCVCRPGVSLSGQENTLGLPMDKTCRSCLVGYYGYNTGEGCQECSCDEGGSESQQCNEDGCICKPTIGGARCDQCQDGYYNYSPLGCMACNCSIAGSLNETCDAFTGTCYCKANTEGVQCDSCVPRSFNLHEANPQGCQDCFCYGHGGNCSSAEGFYGSSIVASSTRLWEIAHVNGSPYLKAPPEFLNDQSASYMQYLSFELRSRRQPVWLPNATLVILESSEDTLLYQRTDLNISDDSFTEFNILLHESEFVTVVGDQPSSFQMHQLLSDLQALYIAMQLLNETSDVVDVSLDTGVQVNETQPENNRVMSVENCTCLDDHYVDGPQCMQCMLGHMRAVGNGTVYDVCLACNCSGNTLGDQPECNDTTGECLNCRNGTVGFHCEQCAPHVNEPFCTECERGYFGLSKEGCQACPDCDSGFVAEDIGVLSHRQCSMAWERGWTQVRHSQTQLRSLL
ncbi:PREDICTED: laminin subunit gamma-1-like, partial [Priapulus caudatus]|uniref:Laminin subunit gamma-1-like n=1 Tax=Priapulus caudatus TaxID=37621 RepID=A0ABM1ES41_PRICU